jgi:ABC-2 type transport system permease protein
MKMQTSASFKKEIMAFTRTKKLFVLLCVFAGFAVLDPALIRGMGAIMEAVGEADIIGDMLGDITSYASNGVSGLVGDLALSGTVIFLLLINSFAGGEQKRRSIIIPRSAGLGNHAYIVPKFVVYPLAAFGLCLFAVITSALVSAAIFVVNDLSAARILTSGILLGVNLAMYTGFHLCIGTATGRAGASAAICIGASILVPGFFAMLSMNMEGDLIAYNPFALTTMASTAVYQIPDTAEMLVTIAIAVALIVICCLLALFAQNAKKIDNKGNEILI